MNWSEGNVGVLYGKRFGLELVCAITWGGRVGGGGGRVTGQKQNVKVSPATLRPAV